MSDDIDAALLQILLSVAPDIDPLKLKRDVDFREQFDFDSMDTLNFAIGIHERFHVTVPETDYRHLANLGKAARYVEQHIDALT